MWSAHRSASSGEDLADAIALHKRLGVQGDEKETPARRKDGVVIPPSVQTAALSRDHLSIGRADYV